MLMVLITFPRESAPIPRKRASQVELHRFFTLIHDSISGLVRRMDRVHVGLFTRWRADLHTVFLGYCGHR